MGEEGDPALGRRGAQRGHAVDELEDEPEAEDDDRRDLDELVEEDEEDEGQDPGPGVQDDVRPEGRRDRPGRADERDVRARLDPDLGQGRGDAAEEVEDEERQPARGGPRCCCRRSTGRACCRSGATSRRGGTGWRRRRSPPARVARPVERRRDPAGTAPQVSKNRLEGGLAARAPRRSARRRRRPRRPRSAPSVTTGVRRVGFASRSGITARRSGRAVGRPGAGLRRRPTATGPGSLVSGARTARRIAWDVIQTIVSGASAMPGSTYQPRASAQSVAPPASRYCSMYSPLALKKATTRWFAGSIAVDPAGPALRAGGDDGVDRARRAGAPSGGRVAAQPSAVAADDAQDRAVVGDPDVAVDVQRGDPVHRPRGGQPLRRRGREAAPVGGRGVGQDLLLGGIDDVEVVEPGPGVAEERADRPEVVAPLRRAGHLDLRRRAPPGRVGGTPAPQDVLRRRG